MQPPHILCIDDEQDLLELVRYNFEKEGYIVTLATDTDQGMRFAKTAQPDLIVLDLMMPDMNGLDFLRYLKATEVTRDIPIIVLSAKATEADRVVGLEIGAQDYVTKPFSPRELVARARAILRAARRGHPIIPTAGSLTVSPVFNGRNFAHRDNYCFVLMPFALSWSDRVWKQLRSIVANAGFTCKRADDLYGRDILEDIWTAIYEATVIVADVTARNPNVMYEVGIAHTLGKDAILLTQDAHDIPFDFRRYRHLVYQDNSDGFAVLSNLLPNYLRERKTAGIAIREEPMAARRKTRKRGARSSPNTERRTKRSR